MPRPILRLATRFTRRTRATAWAIAFACMVLVGAMSLADGLANGVGSVANRIGSGPAVYIQGNELLASAIDSAALSNVPGDFVAMRAHAAGLEINRLTLSVFVVALESYHGGIGTIAFPPGPRNMSLDFGLRKPIERESGRPVAAPGNVNLFGLHVTALPLIALLVYAAMSLEAHAGPRELATLRSVGASPATVAGVYEAQAAVLALAGAILGSALGIVAAHAVVSFAPILGLPNLVVLSPPTAAVLLALLISGVAAVLAGLVPSRRAAVLVRAKGAVPS